MLGGRGVRRNNLLDPNPRSGELFRRTGFRGVPSWAYPAYSTQRRNNYELREDYRILKLCDTGGTYSGSQYMSRTEASVSVGVYSQNPIRRSRVH